MSSAPNVTGSAATGGPQQPPAVAAPAAASTAPSIDADLQKRIDYFKKCAKKYVSTKIPKPFLYEKSSMPDKLNPPECGWRFVQGPDPNDYYKGSSWKLVNDRDRTKDCDKPGVAFDLTKEECPNTTPDQAPPAPGQKKPGIDRPPAPEPVKPPIEPPKPPIEPPEPPVQPPKPITDISGAEDPIGDDPTGGDLPTGREQVKLSGRTFYIDYDKQARERRKAVFSGTSQSSQLTDTEEELLQTIGIEGATRDSVKDYLPDFFNSLPSCQTTSAMMTSRKCEIAYYIMWSVLFKARQEVQRQIDDARTKGMPEKEIFQIEARLNAMSQVNATPTADVGSKETLECCEKYGQQGHEEHVAIEDILKRVEGKLDGVKTNVDTLKAKKGGGQVRSGLSEIQRLFARING